MRVPLLFSVAFHVAIFLFAIFGLPTRDADVVEDYRVIDVEVVSETQTPEPQPIPKEKQEARKEPEPPPAPKLAPPPPPPPPPEEVATLPPEPKPEPKPEPVPEVVPIPEPKPKPAEAPPKPKPVEEPPKAKVEEKPKPAKQAPRPKPRPRPDFNTMMLKTVQKLKETPPPKQEQKEKEKEKEKKSFDDEMAALMQRKDLTPQEKAQHAPLGESLSVSEIDAIRRQIERCWLVPAAIGAKDVGEMKVDIELTLNPDGSLRSARIVDQFRAEINATYKAVAESALRAVRNPRCNKFNLPLKKYEIWKDMIVGFDPSEMVGR